MKKFCVLSSLMMLCLLPSGCFSEPEWSFVVLADIHGMTGFSYVSLEEAVRREIWTNNQRVLQQIQSTFGGDLVILPGDQVSYGAFRTAKILDKLNRPELTEQEAIYTAAMQSSRNTRALFADTGYSTVLVTVGDHEIGGNEGFRAEREGSKTTTIPNYRQGFVDGYNRDEDGNFLFDAFFGSVSSRPVGTTFEGSSFVYRHKNAAFITVDAFRKVGDEDFLDRETGKGGEGTITCTVEGDHLTWFESVLAEARNDNTIKHIFVQAHVPIMQPVRKVDSSGQFLDGSTSSDFWRLMEEYGVDVYFAGEVHSNTASKSTTSDLIQIVSRGNFYNNLLSVRVTDEAIDVHLQNEVGDMVKWNANYVESGRLTIDKSNPSDIQVTSNGDLKLLDTQEPILSFDFETIHPLGSRQILSVLGTDSLIAERVDIGGVTYTDTMYNLGEFGSQYDALVDSLQLVEGHKGKAGAFQPGSKVNVYGFGPFGGGEAIGFSLWMKTTESSSEMVMAHYGTAWAVPAIGRRRDHFTLTLDQGVPAVRIQPKRKLLANIPSIADNQWHHVSVSMPYNSCLLSEVEIWVDGKRTTTSLSNGLDLHIFALTAGRLSLGSVGFFTRVYETSYPELTPYTGLMDDFKLWGRPLELNEVEGCLPCLCMQFCESNENPWNLKCSFEACNGCEPCLTKCPPWCTRNTKPWESKCKWQSCYGCEPCHRCDASCQVQA